LQRLHSGREWLYVFLFVLGLGVLHLMANVVDSKLPQTVSYVVSPDAAPLSSLYVPQDGSAPTSYLIRNYALRYAIYPVLLVTFLVDRFSLVKYLGWLHWKSLGGGVLGVGLVATLVSSPYLEGYGQFPLVLLYQVGFRGSSAAFYVYAVVAWFLLVVLSYRFLDGKLPKHGALWLTFLLFASVEEVWEYAYYVHSMSPIRYTMFVNPPPLHFFTLYIWRATPTFLLLFYAYRLGFKGRVQGSWMERLFLASITMSALLIIIPKSVNPVWLSVSLRVIWAAAYISFAYYLVPESSHPRLIYKEFLRNWRLLLLTLLIALAFGFGMFVRNYEKPAVGLVNVFPAYFFVSLMGLAATVLYLTDHKHLNELERITPERQTAEEEEERVLVG